jgi:Dihydrofolate reductase
MPRFNFFKSIFIYFCTTNWILIMPHISIIAAVASNNAIGKDNTLLCHLPGDLQRFKRLTLHHTVIMGHKTFLSLPNGALPNRKNIVLSKTVWEIPNCIVKESLEEALESCKDEDEVFIIGGGMLYKQALPLADRLYLTHINASLDGDTFFPLVDYSQWTETMREDLNSGEKCPHPYSFVNYERKCN